MNFYRPKEVLCNKTESGGHTRWPQGRGHAQGGRARPPPLWWPRVSFGLLLIFLIFKYSKTEKIYHWKRFGAGLLTVPHTYSFSESETFWKVSLMYSSGVTVSIILVSTFMGVPEI